MQVYNTLTKRKEEFLPPGSPVRMFVCGPTVYDYIHIGNARTYVAFDMIAKYLTSRGYDVDYIQNITDIEDKIIARAAEHNTDSFSYSQEYENRFLEDVEALGIGPSIEYKRATHHIPQVIAQVQTLVDKGHAYLIEGDGWYFDLATFPEYGKLSGRTAMMADDAVSRIDENDKKRNRGDFCLWKLSKPGEPSWESELGKGRPGWHIEDTAITQEYFGPQYDLHGGGIDLMFPHHEAEIAQQESASGKKPFVKYWMHAGFLTISGSRMGKSKGNFTTAREALKQYSAEVLRFYFLSSHYRSPLDYSDASLTASGAAVQRIGEFRQRIDRFEDEMPSESNPAIDSMIRNAQSAFIEAMDDDFNVPSALASLFDLIKELNPLIMSRTMDQDSARQVIAWLDDNNSILGIVPQKMDALPTAGQKLVEQRERARSSKDFPSADKLRDEILAQGFQIDDTTYGPLVKQKQP